MAGPVVEPPSTTPLSYRRYCLLKRLTWLELDDSAMAGVWRSKQEEQPGTALPSTFPYLYLLTPRGYTTREDLDGADVYELERTIPISRQDARVVLSAFNALPP